MRTLALANQKGGVGKTTTAVHLAHGLAIAGVRVGLFDFDPQANATLALQGLLSDEIDGELDPLQPAGPGLWVLPSPGVSRNLAPTVELGVDGLERLARTLASRLDVLLVDCPPRMDTWGWAGLRLCEEVLVPVQSEFFAMHGLSQMLATLDEAQALFPGRARLLGVVITMFDDDEPVAHEVAADLRQNLGEQVLDAVILRDAQLVEAASHGVSTFSYNPFSKAARCYTDLAREIAQRWALFHVERTEVTDG